MVNFGQLGKALDKAKSLAGQHSGKIGDAIDKSVEAVDKATGGKHHDKIVEGAAKLKDATGKLTDQGASGSADAAGTADAPGTPLRDRDPATGTPPAPAQDAPVSDPGSAGPAADAPVADPEAPKDAS